MADGHNTHISPTKLPNQAKASNAANATHTRSATATTATAPAAPRRVPLSQVVTAVVSKWSKEYLSAANDGDPNAMCLVAQMYLEHSGWGDLPNNDSEGRKWLARAKQCTAANGPTSCAAVSALEDYYNADHITISAQCVPDTAAVVTDPGYVASPSGYWSSNSDGARSQPSTPHPVTADVSTDTLKPNARAVRQSASVGQIQDLAANLSRMSTRITALTVSQSPQITPSALKMIPLNRSKSQEPVSLTVNDDVTVSGCVDSPSANGSELLSSAVASTDGWDSANGNTDDNTHCTSHDDALHHHHLHAHTHRRHPTIHVS